MTDTKCFLMVTVSNMFEKKNKNNEDVINSFSDQFVLDNLIDN